MEQNTQLSPPASVHTSLPPPHTHHIYTSTTLTQVHTHTQNKCVQIHSSISTDERRKVTYYPYALQLPQDLIDSTYTILFPLFLFN